MIAAITLVAITLAATAASRVRRPPHAPTRDASTEIPAAPVRKAPRGERVRVQVLNGTKARGLARRATLLLRDKGFDVVEMGTVTTLLDTTEVHDLSGHPEWARRIADALGNAPVRIVTRPDSSRYLDITVVLGASWRPPAEPFYP